MFRPMRRNGQILNPEQSLEILAKATSGVLAVQGDDDYPYTVPLSFLLHENKIYFHCAKEGHKMDGIKRNPKVSFCIIDMDDITPAERTTYFRSVIVFGKAEIIENEAEKKEIMLMLLRKFAPELAKSWDPQADSTWPPVCVMALNIEQVTGKESLKYRKKKERERELAAKS